MNPPDPLREAAEELYVRIMHAHDDALRAGDPHQWWHDLEREWRQLGAVLDGFPVDGPRP